MTDDFDAVREYSRVKLALSNAQDAVLKSLGHSWTSINDLEWRAERQMMNDSVTTEFGTLTKKVTPYWIERAVPPSGYRTELRFSKHTPTNTNKE